MPLVFPSVISSVMSCKDPLALLLRRRLVCVEMKRSKLAKGVPTDPPEIECCYANINFVFLVFENMAADHMCEN